MDARKPEKKSAQKAAGPSPAANSGKPTGKAPATLKKFSVRAPKSIAYLLCGILLLFSAAGIIAAATLGLSGLRLISPVLLGPGITVLGLGALYDFTIRPLASFHEELHSMIARTYFVLGALFSIMGIVFWFVG